MNITIIAVGKLKETYWHTAEAEYLKRLAPYDKITIEELKEEPFLNKEQGMRSKEQEAKKILAKLNESDTVIALHETGTSYTSVQFAHFLEKQTEQGQHLTFIIGGPLGLHESILKRADVTLSLSPLTFPHQMVRTVLLEQLYRAVTIRKGKLYHY